MDIHFINLDRSQDRLDAFLRNNAHIPGLHRFAAVDGEAIDLQRLLDDAVISPDLVASRPAIGISLSHIALWEVVASGTEPATILEDDAVLCANFVEQSQLFIESLDSDWDHISWGYNFDARLVYDMLPGISPSVLILDQEAMRTQLESFPSRTVHTQAYGLIQALGIPAYAVTPAGARRLLDVCRPLRPTRVKIPLLGDFVRYGIDAAMCDAYPQIKSYVAIPPLALTENDQNTSSTHNAVDRPVTEVKLEPNPSPVFDTDLRSNESLAFCGPDGITYDFNEGCRVQLPPRRTGEAWLIEIYDCDTDTVLFTTTMSHGLVVSKKRYYVRFRIRVFVDTLLVFEHVYNAEGRHVLMRMELLGLGDQLAWTGHVAAFAEQHGCEVTCLVKEAFIPLLSGTHASVRFVSALAADSPAFYATYRLFIFYNDGDLDWQPVDYRQAGLLTTAAYILGLEPAERRPVVNLDDGGAPLKDRYVCVAAQATTQNKYWNNPFGWSELVTYLRARGYRVICIDRERAHGRGLTWNYIPYGAEDQTGTRSLTERARWLRHADFFVGLSSGLSWLAWAVECPVVMISGFTQPYNEFHSISRVINRHVCHGCSNDIRHQLDPTDFFWCPRHQATARQFECTRAITSQAVIEVIERALGPSFLSSADTAEHSCSVADADANTQPLDNANYITDRLFSALKKA